MRRGDSACGQDHLTPGDQGLRAMLAGAGDTDGAVIFQHNPRHLRIGEKRQIGPTQHRLEKAARRRPATTIFLVDLKIRNAFIIPHVEIVDFGNAALRRCIHERIQDFPAHTRRIDAPFPASAMKNARTQIMIFVTLEQRQNIRPAPAPQADLRPGIIIRRLPAHVNHGVDGRRATDDLASGISQRAAIEARNRLGAIQPVSARIANGKQIANGDVEPDPVIAPPALDQRDPDARIGRQAIGKHAPGRAGTYDDIVKNRCRISHISPSWE